MQDNPAHNTNWQEVAKANIRPIHRYSNQQSFFKALVQPLMVIRDEYRRFRESVIYQLQHDSRKISIEKVLNDHFDDSLRRIYIDNVAPQPRTYFYEPGDDRPVFFYEPADDRPVYFYEQLGVNVDDVSFVVNLPDTIKPSDPDELRRLEILINAQVNRYKLDSKEHRLLWMN